MDSGWQTLGLAVSLLVQAAGPHAGPALLTLPQRDAARARTAPAAFSVSADGQHIAFVSYVRLVTAGTVDRAGVYVLDRQTGLVTFESLGVDGRALGGDSAHPRLSGDGRYLVFDAAFPIDAAGTPGVHVLLRDRTAATTRLVSVTPEGGPPDGRSTDPVISADGSVVVFTSSATNLVRGRDENGVAFDVYLYETASARLHRLSVDSRGVQKAHGNSYAPGVSADGRYVVFVSTADLVDNPGTVRIQPPQAPSRPYAHVYLRDVRAGTTIRISGLANGDPANGASWAPAISADGRYVAFTSAASNLVPGDRNRAADVFLHDRKGGTTTLVSRSARRGSGNGASINPVISADGRIIAFQSEASDLVCAGRCPAGEEDVNLLFDVFVFDRETRTMRRVSRGPDVGWPEESGSPAISGGGEVIVFASRHPIDAEDTGHDFDVYVSLGNGRLANAR